MVRTMKSIRVKWLSKWRPVLAFKEGVQKGAPVLLEPIMKVEVVVPGAISSGMLLAS